MMPISCFLLTPTSQVKIYLRRYSHYDGKDLCTNGYSHEARNLIAVAAEKEGEASRPPTEAEKKDARWPTTCERCGKYKFVDTDYFQHFTQTLYARTDTGEKMTLQEAPAGAMWYADWMLVEGSNWMKGPDGHCLMVKCPGGDWCPDQRCSNCTLPNDDDHKCWVRHGIPPLVTVDKNGHTCNAGAGSIGQPTWHGFLQNGQLVS